MNEYHAAECERLLRDDTLNLVLDTLRREALEALVLADAADVTAILRLQQSVEAVDGIRARMRAEVARGSVAVSPAGSIA